MTRPDELVPALRGTDRAGVYALPPGGPHTLADAAHALGFVLRRIDLADCADKSSFLARVAEGLDFPTWFGGNFDALADCLGDLDWLPAPGYVFILEHADRFRAAAEADFVTALEILDEAARERADAGTPMWFFVGLAADGIAHLRSL